MPGRYYIRGEAGKALNATDRLLGEDLKVIAATMKFEHLGVDRLTWSALTADLLAGETILPEVGQRVELFFDVTGAGSLIRCFRGRVSKAALVNYGAEVEVEGPWAWLLAHNVTSTRTLNGSSDTRPAVEFPYGTLGTWISNTITAALSAGAPLINAGVVTTYDIHKLKLSKMSYADVLMELLRWVPDGVLAWDYQSSSVSDPWLKLVRRGSGMASQSYAVGTAPLADYQASQRADLVPSRVELKYIVRGGDTRPIYTSQTAGSAVAGRVQTIVISGDENDTYLPPDDYESYTVQTQNANVSGTALKDLVLSMIPEVKASRAVYGSPSSNDVTLANGENVKSYKGLSSPSSNIYNGYYDFFQPVFECVDTVTGSPVSRVGKYFVTTPVPPEWAAGTLANVEKVILRGTIYRLELITKYDWNTGQEVETNVQNIPGWAVFFPWVNDYYFRYHAPGHSSNTRNPTVGYEARYFALNFEIETFITTTSYPSQRTIYKPQDYDFLAPATGLAANLLAAQSTGPIEGHIDLEFDDASAPVNLVATKMNITGGHAGLATMNAMVRSVSYDLVKHKARVELGAPKRFDFKTLDGVVRQDPQTNITINNS